MSKDILSYGRSGAWSTNHSLLYRFTYASFSEFQLKLQKLTQKEKKVKLENNSLSGHDLNMLISHETDELKNALYKDATSVVLFACMCIEAFLNCYGTRRLREDFYKKNIERLGITEKFSLIIVIFFGSKLENDSRILKKLRCLFDRRNRLVHPKTREIRTDNLDNFISDPPGDWQIQKVLDDMEEILTYFCSFDNNIVQSFEFPKTL